MPRDDDLSQFDGLVEPGDDSPELDYEHFRVFSLVDDEDDLDRETDESTPDKPSLEQVLTDLEQGQRFYADLYGFSDLSAKDLETLRERWANIAPELRASVVREAFDIGQEDFNLHLTRFFLFAAGDEDDSVRQLAVSALGNESNTAVATLLLEIVTNDRSPDIRAEAATSLGPYAMFAVFEELPEELARNIKRVLLAIAETEDESWHIRRRAAESVSAFGPSPRVNALIQRMYDEDEIGLRASALFAAGRANQREWLPTAIDELENEDAEIRFEAARAAGMFGDVDALPPLSELAKDEEDTEARHAAIAAIGEIGGQGAIRILTRLAEDAPESDQDVIDDALIEASLESDPFSFGADPDAGPDW